MPIINITEADLKKTKVYPAGWYPSKIVKVSNLETASAGDSVNLKVTFAIGGGAAGKEIEHTFNSKLWGMLEPLVTAVTGKTMDPGSFDADILMGKEPDVSLVVDTYKGNLQNKISNFLPKGKGGNTAPF